MSAKARRVSCIIYGSRKLIDSEAIAPQRISYFRRSWSLHRKSATIRMRTGSLEFMSNAWSLCGGNSRKSLRPMSGQNCLNQRGLIQVQIKMGKNVSLLQTYLDIRPGAMMHEFQFRAKGEAPYPPFSLHLHPLADCDEWRRDDRNHESTISKFWTHTCEDNGIGETGNRCTIRQD